MAKKKTDVVTTQEVKPKAKALDYKVKVELSGEIYESETNDITEYIFGLKPKKICTKTIVSVTKGGRTFTKVLNVFQARRLFNNRLTTFLLERQAKTKVQ